MSFLRSFRRDERGAILIELGFALPVLVTILLGCFEASRYVLLNQKLDRAAAAMSDLVAQADGISEAQIADLFSASGDVAEPFDLLGDGRVVVSSVTRPTAAPATVAWQRLSPGTHTATSEVGAAGATAVLPPGLLIRTGENIIVAEVFFEFHPYFFGSLFEVTDLYHSAFNRPRVINLTTVNP